MPRESKQQITQRTVPQGSTRQPEKAKAAATAIDALPAYIPQQRDETLQGLLQGLSSISPIIQQKLQETKVEEAGQAQTDALAGVEPQNATENYQYHYMHTDGLVKGREDATALWESYHTEFDKDGGDLDKFLAEKYKAKVGGIKPGAFLTGYDKSLSQMLDNIRADRLDYHKKTAVARVESNTMKLMDDVVGSFIKADTQIPDDYLENLESTASKTGVSKERFQELLFEAVRKNAEDGHFEAFDLLKKNRSDGSPGLYYDPKWMDKIESAQDAAYAKAEARGKQVRQERQETALYGVFDKLYSGDAAGAKAEYDSLVKQGLFTRASDRIKWEGEFTKVQNKEARADQQAAELELQAGIYKGSVGIQDVIKADLTAPQKRSLLSEIHRVQQDARMVAATASKQENAIFKTSEFRAGEEYIKGALSSVASPLDPFGTGSLFDKQQKSAAILEFTQAAQRAKDPAELNAIREEIVGRYLKRRKEMPPTDKQMEGAGLIRYSSPAEVAKALRDGKLSFEEGQIHLNFFKAKKTNAR